MRHEDRFPFRQIRDQGSPLTDEDFARIRHTVMAEVERRERRRGWAVPVRLAVAALALVLVVALALVFQRNAAPSIAPARVAETDLPSRHPDAGVNPDAAARATSGSEPAAAQAASPTSKVEDVGALAPGPAPRPGSGPPSLVAQARNPPITISLQTSNPDIRIIWIAR